METDTVWSVAWGSLLQPESELLQPESELLQPESEPLQPESEPLLLPESEPLLPPESEPLQPESEPLPLQPESEPLPSPEGGPPVPPVPSSEPDAVWGAHCTLLARYVAERREFPKVKTVYEGACLGGWVCRQRRYHWAGKRALTAERRAALEAIDGWEWREPARDRWWRMYELLWLYVAEHGVLPGARTVYGGKGLGKWVCNQRSCRRIRLALKPDRIRALEEVRGWRWETRTDQSWQHYYRLLRAYVRDRGELPAPGKRCRDGARLGNWVLRQRALGEALPQARYDALDALEGWRW